MHSSQVDRKYDGRVSFDEFLSFFSDELSLFLVWFICKYNELMSSCFVAKYYDVLSI